MKSSPAAPASSAPAIDATTMASPRFAGKVALITGASDRGIGGEIAVRLAREGAAVALVSRRVPERLLKKVNRFEQVAIHSAGDVTKSDDDSCSKSIFMARLPSRVRLCRTCRRPAV
jgi:NADP-dependent 3-hydroxy acid dehydrogenase YdfG